MMQIVTLYIIAFANCSGYCNCLQFIFPTLAVLIDLSVVDALKSCNSETFSHTRLKLYQSIHLAMKIMSIQ